MNDSLLRFLSLAQQQLGGIDARAEIGGRPPTAEEALYYDADGQFRIVVMFDAPPRERHQLELRLEELVKAFLESASPPAVRTHSAPPDSRPEARLQEALVQLVERAGARAAAVLDRTSPVLWGTSLDPAEPRDALALSSLAESSAPGAASDAQLIGCAVGLVRSEDDHAEGLFIEDSVGFVLRWFAGVYCLVVAFDRTASELKVKSSVIRVLPYIEKLVLSLPPVSPEPKGKKVGRLPLRLV